MPIMVYNNLLLGVINLNILLGVLLLLLNFSMVIIAYKYFGKAGLFAWIAIASILANIQVVKTIMIFGFEATLGNVIYGSLSLATDIINEKYGKKVANKGIYIGFFALLVSLISMEITLRFIPSAHDVADNALHIIFSPAFRIVLGSLAAYLVSQLLDVIIYAKIRQKLPATKHLWIRNKASTFISKFVDSLIFVSVAFIGVFEIQVLIQIYLTTYLLGVVIAILDTPFVYIAKSLNPNE